MLGATQTVARSGRPTGFLWRLGVRTLADREAALGLTIVGATYLFYLGFIFVPMLLAFYVSTTVWDAMGPLSKARFIGLQNYVDLIQDSRFRMSLWHDLEWTLKAYAGQMGLGLALALLLMSLKRFRSLARFVTFSPFILPMVATAILFTILMNPVWGSLNMLLRLFGAPSSAWLTDTESAMNSVILMVIWKYAGYYMVLFLTALMAVPQEYYDAAHIDGAGRLQSFFYITWPLIRPAFFFISVTNVIGNMQVFTPVFIMTGGGPNRATEVAVVLMYHTAFTNFRYSAANAMAVILFVVILLLTLIQMRVLRQQED